LLAQVKRAQRPLDTQQRPVFHFVEHVTGKGAARNVADMQFEKVIAVRRVGNRKRAPAAVLENELYVLAGEELKTLAFRQLEHHLHDIVRQPLQVFGAAWQRFNDDIGRRLDFAYIDNQVAVGMGFADDNRLVSRVAFQCVRFAVGIMYAAGNQPGYAGSAGAITAAIGQAYAVLQRSVEYRLPAVDREPVSGGCYGDLEAHAGFQLQSPAFS